jgi:hypothetical protein
MEPSTSATSNNNPTATTTTSPGRRLTRKDYQARRKKDAEGLALLREAGHIYKQEVDIANATGEVSQVTPFPRGLAIVA